MPFAFVFALFLAVAAQRAPVQPPVQTVEVKAAFPHDPQAFTQGLFFADGQLYESTGLVGQSTIRRVNLQNGKVLQMAAIPAGQFGEGSTAWGTEIVSITWQNGVGHRWDRKTLRRVGGFRYSGEGWGLTNDGRSLILSDGTATLRFLHPRTFAEQRRVQVTAQGRAVSQLNELEYVNGEVWANVWQTPLIARIDPGSGAVKGWIDLSALVRASGRGGMDDVANGIAYEPRSKRLFVTGKRWPKLFEVTIKPAG
jgi:glutamine cyclotransferase